MASSDSPDAVDWSLAARVGRAVAGAGPTVTSAERAAVRREFVEAVSNADALVRDFTGLRPHTPAGEPLVLDRAGWIDANISGFQKLMEPVAEKIGKRGRRIGGMAVGIQIGLLLGYISQKVLGQYDLLFAPSGPGRVYFVGPNVIAAERRWKLDRNDFRLWIALHEVTHRTQFVAVDWLKGHVHDLIGRYLGAVELDVGRLKELAGNVKELLASGPSAWRRANIVSLFLTQEQREVVGQMQALMCVVEGHGNFVMDRIGARQIPSLRSMRSSLTEQRAQVGMAERTLQRVIGLDLKYQQYALGEAFIAAVDDAAGMEGVNRVWARPENLPSMEEIRDPGLWLARVRAGATQERLFDRPVET